MPAIILLTVNFIAMKSKNRIFFPSVRAALIALAASAMFACSDDDEGFADLAVDSPSLEIQAGQTGLVRILAGSGEYTCTGNDPQIADVQLAEQTISVRGLASGSTSFAVEDTRTGQSLRHEGGRSLRRKNRHRYRQVFLSATVAAHLRDNHPFVRNSENRHDTFHAGEVVVADHLRVSAIERRIIGSRALSE